MEIEITEVVLLVVVVGLFIVVGLFANVLLKAFAEARESLPSWANELIQHNSSLVLARVDEALAKLQGAAAGTQNSVDDELVALLIPRIREIVREALQTTVDEQG